MFVCLNFGSINSIKTPAVTRVTADLPQNCVQPPYLVITFFLSEYRHMSCAKNSGQAKNSNLHYPI